MAYGSWINKGWELVKDVWDSKYNQYGYEIHVEWGYRQDKVANKTEYRATQVKLVSKNGHRVQSNNNTTAGIGVGINPVLTTKENLNTWMEKVGDAVIQDLDDASTEVAHNSDGTLSTKCYIHGKYYVNVNISGVPTNEWFTKEITSSIPAIDRSAGTAGISVASKTYNSVTLTLTSNVHAEVCRYRINGGSWVEFSTNGTNIAASGGGTISKTITGLAANTSYTIEFQVCKTMNGVWSNSASTTFTTNKPNAPTAGSVSASSKTHNSITCAISGFSFGAGATFGKYQWSLNNSNWNDIGSNTSFTVTGLSPNTKYTIYARLVDNYGTASNSVSTSVTTNKPSAPTKGTVSVSSKTHNTLTCAISGFAFGSGANWGKYQWSLNGNTWTDIGSNTTFTVSGLTPNTNYTVYVRLVDNYGTVSNNATVSATTNKPSTPTKGSVSVRNITPFGATFSWSGFAFGNGATWGKYEYSTNGSTWTSCGTNTSVTLSSLSPETTYTFYVRLVDNYGTASSNATVQFTTLVDQAKVYLKVNGTWKKGKVFIKKDGAWVKAKKIFIKKNESWKLNK